MSTKSVKSFFGPAKTTAERQYVWDSVFKQNVCNRRLHRGALQMPSERPGRVRYAPGDPRNAKLNSDYKMFLEQLTRQALETVDTHSDHQTFELKESKVIPSQPRRSARLRLKRKREELWDEKSISKV